MWRGSATNALNLSKDPDKNYLSFEKAMTKLFKDYLPGLGEKSSSMRGARTFGACPAAERLTSLRINKMRQLRRPAICIYTKRKDRKEMLVVTGISLMVVFCLVLSLMENPYIEAGRQAARIAAKAGKTRSASGGSK